MTHVNSDASYPLVTKVSGPLRKIIHVDMDAFFASVEQRDHPHLRGKPVAVGGERQRGVVAAASYEARKFGVRSAMSSALALRKCPELIFVKPRFEVYSQVSAQIREIFNEYTDLVEPVSLDEAYLDVTENHKAIGSATLIAQDIRAKIKLKTGLTASAGVSYNRFLAKIASDHRKPDGLFVVTPRTGPDFVELLPVERFHGIGPATTEKMNRLGIMVGRDLRAQSLGFLQSHFGTMGDHYYHISRGIDERPVNPDRERKSVGAENTFFQDIFSVDAAKDALLPIVEKVWRYCEHSGTRGRTVTLKVKYNDFKQITRSLTAPAKVSNRTELTALSTRLLEGVFPIAKGIRLLGVTISALNESDPKASGPQQLSLAI
jgi:DNA polymerase IV